MNRKTLTIGLSALAVVALLGSAGTAPAAVLIYQNTFDADGDNINLGDDPIDPVTFAGSGSAIVESDTFANSGLGNTGGADASGNHIKYVSQGEGEEPNNTSAKTSNTRLAGVADLANELPAGSYDLTITLDLSYADVGTTVQDNVNMMMWGDGDFDSGGNGRWENAFSYSEPTGDFARVSATRTFTLVDNPTSDLPEGHFEVGKVRGVQLQVKIDSRSGDGSPEIARIDNIRALSDTIPEPASLALLGLGGLACLRRRRA